MREFLNSYLSTTGKVLSVSTGVIMCTWMALYAFYTVQDWFRKGDDK